MGSEIVDVEEVGSKATEVEAIEEVGSRIAELVMDTEVGSEMAVEEAGDMAAVDMADLLEETKFFTTLLAKAGLSEEK